MTQIIQDFLKHFQHEKAPQQSLYLEVTNPIVIGRSVAAVRELANRPLEVAAIGSDATDHILTDTMCLRKGDILRVQACISDEEFLISLIGRRFCALSANN